MKMGQSIKKFFLGPPTWKSVVTLLGFAAALYISALAYGRFLQYGKRRLEARLGTDNANEFFGSRIHNGMSVIELARVVPPADRVSFFLQRDGSVVQQFVYRLTLSADYQINAVFDKKRIVDVEFDDSYLGELTPISDSLAMSRLR